MIVVEDKRYGMYNCLFDLILRSAIDEKKRLFIFLTPAGQDGQRLRDAVHEFVS